MTQQKVSAGAGPVIGITECLPAEQIPHLHHIPWYTSIPGIPVEVEIPTSVVEHIFCNLEDNSMIFFLK